MATPKIRDIYAALMETLEGLPGGTGATKWGLGISMILGPPDTGRTTPTTPLGALVFQMDHYDTQPRGMKSRVGQVPPTGNENQAILMIYAGGERELLELVENLRQTKQRVASVSVGSTTLVVRWGPTERYPYAGEERFLMYAAQCGISFSWNE